jgi:hypothetical protein
MGFQGPKKDRHRSNPLYLPHSQLTKPFVALAFSFLTLEKIGGHQLLADKERI